MENSKNYLVLDIGGTSFRIGVYHSAGKQLMDVKKFSTPSFVTYPDYNIDALQNKLVAVILKNIFDYLERYQIESIGVSFAGPIDEKGFIKSAPTIFGEQILEFNLAEILNTATKLKVAVLNDISAAAWRYTEKYGDTFCIITISSGVGNKVLYKNNLLINSNGGGGEIGHHTYDLSDEALACNCGGRGHVGAITSGRGVLELSKRMALNHPGQYQQSILSKYTQNKIEALTTYHIVDAIHAKDPFTYSILIQSMEPIVNVISCIYHAIGVEKYIIIGGFAIAVGEVYIELLKRRIAAIGCFGIKDFHSMLYLGEKDDDHSLIGMGIYLMKDIKS